MFSAAVGFQENLQNDIFSLLPSHSFQLIVPTIDPTKHSKLV